MSKRETFHKSVTAKDATEHDDVMTEEHDVAWIRMFRQLALYQVQNGHCFVPRRDRRHPQLAAWLEKQMEIFHKGKLSAAKQRELDHEP